MNEGSSEEQGDGQDGGEHSAIDVLRQAAQNIVNPPDGAPSSRQVLAGIDYITDLVPDWARESIETVDLGAVVLRARAEAMRRTEQQFRGRFTSAEDYFALRDICHEITGFIKLFHAHVDAFYYSAVAARSQRLIDTIVPVPRPRSGHTNDVYRFPGTDELSPFGRAVLSWANETNPVKDIDRFKSARFATPNNVLEERGTTGTPDAPYIPSEPLAALAQRQRQQYARYLHRQVGDGGAYSLWDATTALTDYHRHYVHTMRQASQYLRANGAEHLVPEKEETLIGPDRRRRSRSRHSSSGSPGIEEWQAMRDIEAGFAFVQAHEGRARPDHYGRLRYTALRLVIAASEQFPDSVNQNTRFAELDVSAVADQLASSMTYATAHNFRSEVQTISRAASAGTREYNYSPITRQVHPTYLGRTLGMGITVADEEHGGVTRALNSRSGARMVFAKGNPFPDLIEPRLSSAQVAKAVEASLVAAQTSPDSDQSEDSEPDGVHDSFRGGKQVANPNWNNGTRTGVRSWMALSDHERRIIVGYEMATLAHFLPTTLNDTAMGPTIFQRLLPEHELSALPPIEHALYEPHRMSAVVQVMRHLGRSVTIGDANYILASYDVVGGTESQPIEVRAVVAEAGVPLENAPTYQVQRDGILTEHAAVSRIGHPLPRHFLQYRIETPKEILALIRGEPAPETGIDSNVGGEITVPETVADGLPTTYIDRVLASLKATRLGPTLKRRYAAAIADARAIVPELDQLPLDGTGITGVFELLRTRLAAEVDARHPGDPMTGTAPNVILALVARSEDRSRARSTVEDLRRAFRTLDNTDMTALAEPPVEPFSDISPSASDEKESDGELSDREFSETASVLLEGLPEEVRGPHGTLNRETIVNMATSDRDVFPNGLPISEFRADVIIDQRFRHYVEAARLALQNGSATHVAVEDGARILYDDARRFAPMAGGYGKASGRPEVGTSERWEYFWRQPIADVVERHLQHFYEHRAIYSQHEYRLLTSIYRAANYSLQTPVVASPEQIDWTPIFLRMDETDRVSGRNARRRRLREDLAEWSALNRLPIAGVNVRSAAPFVGQVIDEFVAGTSPIASGRPGQSQSESQIIAKAFQDVATRRPELNQLIDPSDIPPETQTDLIFTARSMAFLGEDAELFSEGMRGALRNWNGLDADERAARVRRRLEIEAFFSSPRDRTASEQPRPIPQEVPSGTIESVRTLTQFRQAMRQVGQPVRVDRGSDQREHTVTGFEVIVERGRVRPQVVVTDDRGPNATGRSLQVGPDRSLTETQNPTPIDRVPVALYGTWAPAMGATLTIRRAIDGPPPRERPDDGREDPGAGRRPNSPKGPTSLPGGPGARPRRPRRPRRMPRRGLDSSGQSATQPTPGSAPPPSPHQQGRRRDALRSNATTPARTELTEPGRGRIARTLRRGNGAPRQEESHPVSAPPSLSSSTQVHRRPVLRASTIRHTRPRRTNQRTPELVPVRVTQRRRLTTPTTPTLPTLPVASAQDRDRDRGRHERRAAGRSASATTGRPIPVSSGRSIAPGRPAPGRPALGSGPTASSPGS